LFIALALFSINFTPLWDQASKSLSIMASSQPTSFWKIFSQLCSSLCLDDKFHDDMCLDDQLNLFYTDIPFGMRQINQWNLLFREAYSFNTLNTRAVIAFNLIDH
jgi:hypothetical protein